MRDQWQGRANVERFSAQTDVAQGPQYLKNLLETDIVQRFRVGESLLDVGIGTGRVSLPLAATGARLTGLDASAAMIERCARDARASGVRLVAGELAALPFAAQAFDTVISIDTFAHYLDWSANLDELLRVTRAGGRVIVDAGSQDHVDAVVLHGGCAATAVAPALRLSSADLCSFARERQISLVALVPSGVVLGSIAPNGWTGDSYAARSGGLDRLVSWLGADPLLFAFAAFVERRIVAHASPAIAGRMFAVLERRPGIFADGVPPTTDIAAGDERGAGVWRSEFAAHIDHEPNRNFAISFLMASCAALPDRLRHQLPERLRVELVRAERARRRDNVATEVARAWSSAADELNFKGVELAAVFERALAHELRERLDRDE